MYSRIETVVVMALFLVAMALRAMIMGLRWALLTAAWPLQALATARYWHQELRESVLLMLGGATVLAPAFLMGGRLLAAGLCLAVWLGIMALGWFVIPRPDIVISSSGRRVIRPCKSRW